MNPNERALQILVEHRSGRKLRQLARDYGITKQRVQQLCARGREIELERTSGDPWFELNLRIRNALIADGCEPSLDGVLEHQYVRSFRRIPGIGVLAMSSLQAWLARHGKEPLHENTHP